MGHPGKKSLTYVTLTNLVQRIQKIGQADYFPLLKQKFLREYHNVFSGLGELERVQHPSETRGGTKHTASA